MKKGEGSSVGVNDMTHGMESQTHRFKGLIAAIYNTGKLKLQTGFMINQANLTTERILCTQQQR